MNIPDFAAVIGLAVAAGVGALQIARRYPRRDIAPATAQRLALLLLLLWAGGVGTMAVARHLAFHSGAYDLGIFDQAIWNSAQGRFFQTSVTADSPLLLGHHFSPIILVFVPLYWLHPDPTVLIVAQAMLLAAAGLPIFWLARDWLRSPSLSLAVLLAYLLHPATAYVALFDFHEVALAAPLLAAALYLLLRRRYLPFGIALAMMFLVKEEMGLVGAAIGVFIALAQRRWLGGLATAAAGILWTALLLRWVIPGLHPGGGYYYSGLYADLGNTPQDILTGFLRDPGYIAAKVLAPNKQLYLQELLAPLGALPLLAAPVLAVALPVLSLVLLTDKMPADLIRLQYSATLLPPLMAGSVMALRWLRERWASLWPASAPVLTAFVVTAALAGAYLYGPLPLARHFAPEVYRPAPRLAVARQMMAQIPPEATVIAQSDLVPQLSHRRTIQVFSYADPALRPDYYFLDTDGDVSRYPLPQGNDYLYYKAVSRVTADAEYRVIDDREGYLLIKREAADPGQPVGVTFGDQIALAGFRSAGPQASSGETLALKLYWQAKRAPDADYTVFVHLVDRDGRRWGQHDDYPVGKYFPTSEWEPGRLLQSDWTIPIPADAPPGEYRLLVGIYDFNTMRRLPAAGSDAAPRGDNIVLQTISITAGSR
ncbi:MAG: DUF2079 domain-containing protein [Bacteroidetes bacterium]|nr:DUF2079 domain-containing protein [Bacteroidota bacterium]